MKPTLYKYCPLRDETHIDRVIKILSGMIYFSSPKHFNDSFEMAPVLSPPSFEAFYKRLSNLTSISKSAAIKKHQRLVRGFKYKNAVDNKWSDSFGILCLSTSPKNILMWGHYASDHSGVCIGFDSNQSPFSDAEDVHYSYERPRISTDCQDDELYRKVLFTKSKEWHYENEWRCIKRPVSNEQKGFYKKSIVEHPEHFDDIAKILSSAGGHGEYPFETSAIKSVHFGSNIKGEHKEIIMKNIPQSVKVIQLKLSNKYYDLEEHK